MDVTTVKTVSNNAEGKSATSNSGEQQRNENSAVRPLAAPAPDNKGATLVQMGSRIAELEQTVANMARTHEEEMAALSTMASNAQNNLDKLRNKERLMIAAHRKIEDKMAQTQNMWQLEQRRLLKHQHMPEIEKEIEQRIKAFDKRVKRLREAQKGGTLTDGPMVEATHC